MGFYDVETDKYGTTSYPKTVVVQHFEPNREAGHDVPFSFLMIAVGSAIWIPFAMWLLLSPV